MAQLENTVISFGMVSSALTFTPATGSDYFIPGGADGRVAVVINNENTVPATVTLKAGDGTLSPLGDINIDAPAGKIVYVPLVRVESARVKVTRGADKGKVFVATKTESGGDVSKVGIAVVSVE